MNCPKCQNKTIVLSCRTFENVKYRKRKCKECEHIFYTSECEDEKKYYNEAQNQYTKEKKKGKK